MVNHARADELAARSHLVSHGWIPRNAEAFRHLPPPAASLWLGEAEAIASDIAGASPWEVEVLAQDTFDSVDVRRLDAADPAQRRELLANLPLPGDDPAAPFAWAHRVLLREGLRLRVRPAPDGSRVVVHVRRRGDAVEAPMLVIELLPGARCVVLETHHESDAPTRDAIVQNLQVHVIAGERSSLRHLRVVLPASGDRIAHHVRVRLGQDANYEQGLLAAGSAYHLQRTLLDLDHSGAAARIGSVLLAADTCIDEQVLVHHGAASTNSSIDALALGSGSGRLVANAHTTIAAGSDDARARQRLVGVPTRGQPRLVLRPHLEIHHYQVQAAHGATWGALPEDALFLARQRGIDEVTAKAMIMEGMATAIFARALRDAGSPEASGLATWLARAIADHLAAGRKELQHG
jgi:Fe-S cluster assembly protein SufD